MKINLNILIFSAIFSAFTINADANFLGKRYVAIGAGVLSPGDDIVNDIDDSIVTYSANLRYPLNSTYDLLASFGQAKIDGDMNVYIPNYLSSINTDVDGTSTSIRGGIQFHFRPNDQIDPYIGVGIIWSKFEFDTMYESSDDDDFGIVAGGGLEININEIFSIGSGLTYQSEMFDEDDFVGTVSLNIWPTSSFLISVSTDYSFDSEDLGLTGAIGIGF